MKSYKFLPSFWLIALLVGLYQLPLIENALNKQSINIPLNEYFPYSKNFQQYVEDTKISFVAQLDNGFSSPKENQIQDVISAPALSSSLNNSTEHAVASIDNSLTNINPQPSTNTEILVDKKKELCSNNCKVLMMGDSVMGDVDFSLARLMKKNQPSWQIIDAHKVSSGLTNQMYYDWPKTAEKLIEQHKPDYVVVLLGTNDAQGMMINGKGAAFAKDLWLSEYKNRINTITNNFNQKNVSWIWIDLPVVRDVTFNQKLEYIRQAQRQTVGKNLLETESIFGKSDHSEPVNMKLRANDGTHLNSSGANLIAEKLYQRLIP